MSGDNDQTAAKQLFEKLVLERLDEAERRTEHSFSDLRAMIDKLGTWQAAKRLLSPGSTGTFTYGFKLLVRQGLLELSVEQAVIDSADTSLFEEAELSNARARIAMANQLLK